MKRLLIAALLATLAGGAFAQVPGRSPLGLDLDHDGRVTLAEVKKRAAAGKMARLDADRDGRITRAEFKPFEDRARLRGGEAGAGRAAGLFARLDADGDGAISKPEREAAAARRFSMVDTNHDGWLSRGEVLMLRQNRQRAD